MLTHIRVDIKYVAETLYVFKKDVSMPFVPTHGLILITSEDGENEIEFKPDNTRIYYDLIKGELSINHTERFMTPFTDVDSIISGYVDWQSVIFTEPKGLQERMNIEYERKFPYSKKQWQK